MADIELNYEAHKVLVDRVTAAAGAVDTGASVTSQSTLGVAVEHMDCIRRLADLLTSYTALLEKDCKYMTDLMKNIRHADNAP